MKAAGDVAQAQRQTDAEEDNCSSNRTIVAPKDSVLARMIEEGDHTHFVLCLGQIQVLVHHSIDLRIMVAFQNDLALLRKPPENIEAVRIDRRVACRHAAVGTRQGERSVDNERLQTAAVTEREAHDLGEAFQDFGVGRDLELDVLDVSTAALVERSERADSGGDVEVKDVLAVQNVSCFFVDLF